MSATSKVRRDHPILFMAGLGDYKEWGNNVKIARQTLKPLTSVIGSAGLGWSGLVGRFVGETAVRAAPDPFLSFELDMISFMSSLFFCK